MTFKRLKLNDKFTPIEGIIGLIREGKLNNVAISWKGKDGDAHNPTLYTVSGETKDEVLLRGFGLEPKE